MQTSELYRRGIVMPLDKHAEEDLRRADVGPETSVRLVSLDDDQIFAELCRLKFFERVNRAAGTLIDEYEEEVIEVSALHFLLDATAHLQQTSASAKVQQIAREIRDLARVAQDARRPLFFVL